MLLPLACLIFALEGMGWRLFDAGGVYSPHPWSLQGGVIAYAIVWPGYLGILVALSYALARVRQVPPPVAKSVLHISSCLLYLYLLPWGQGLPDALWESGWTWRPLWELTSLAPYLAGDMVILRRPSAGSRSLPWILCARHLGFMLLPYLLGQALFEGALWMLGDGLLEPRMAFPVALGLMTSIVFLMPSVAILMIPAKPLEPGPLRSALASQLAEAGMDFRNILVWDMGPTQANAAVLGMLPSLRYLLVTPPMMEIFSPSELRLVLWHELGHVARRHLWIYYLFFMAAGGVSVLVLGSTTSSPGWLTSLGTLVAWVGAFSWLSRSLERQADLYAQDHESVPGEYARVLIKLAAVSGIPERFRSLTHGSIRSRVDSLESLATSPSRTFKFHRRIRRMVLACLVVLSLEWAWWAILHGHSFMGSWAS